MKELIRESWKTAVAFAAGAFLLSLLIGLIARNPFGVIFLRALLFGVIFAALGVGLRLAVRTWLPELAGQAGAAPGEPGTGPDQKAGASLGGKVDIVVGEGAAAPGDLAGEAEEVAEEPASVEPERLEESEAAVSPAEAAALGEINGELAQARTEPEEAPAVEEGETAAEPIELPDALDGRSDAGLDRLDSLPDIALQEPPAAPAARARSRKQRPAPEEALRESVSRQDPATLARALRTVLKKDEKG